jgi:glycosyltransferase involved in cell wall biosynthesis
MKLQREFGLREIGMSAVFGDMSTSSYDELVRRIAQVDKNAKNGRLLKLIYEWVPSRLRLFLGYGYAVLRFLFNLETALGTINGRRAILHAHDLTSGYFCHWRNRRRYPRVFTIHSRGGWVREWTIEHSELKGGLVERILKYMEDTAAREADVVVFTSKGSQELFESYHPHLLEGKAIRIAHSGADIDELDSVMPDNGVLTKYGLMKESKVVLCVAAMVQDKGHACLVDAVALLPPEVRNRTSFIMVGEGPLKKQLLSRVVNEGLEGIVRFLGFLPRADLIQLMRASTLFVLPARAVVFDAVLLEAGALGLPIITSAVGGNLEMFDQESALLIPPGQPEALARALAELLADEELRSRIGEKARERTRTMFPLQNLLQCYATIYEEAWETWQQKRERGR